MNIWQIGSWPGLWKGLLSKSKAQSKYVKEYALPRKFVALGYGWVSDPTKLADDELDKEIAACPDPKRRIGKIASRRKEIRFFSENTKLGDVVLLYNKGCVYPGIIDDKCSDKNYRKDVKQPYYYVEESDSRNFIKDAVPPDIAPHRINIEWISKEPYRPDLPWKELAYPRGSFRKITEDIIVKLKNKQLANEIKKLKEGNIVWQQDANKKVDENTNVLTAVDIEPPMDTKRTKVTENRIIRDTELSRRVKDENGYKCQICDKTLKLKGGELYAEAHHIKPLGAPHNGPDIRENILCVCPNHHVLLDYKSIRLDYSLCDKGIRKEYIDFHNKKFFGED